MKALKQLTQHLAFALVALGAAITAALAEAPIEDLSQQSSQGGGGFEVREMGPGSEENRSAQSAPQNYHSMPQPSLTEPSVETRNMPMDQRVARLEQQMNNLVQMNLVGKMSALEQQIQQLQGKLEEQAHELKTLSEQQRKFYEDLDQRLNRTNSAAKAGNKTENSDNTNNKENRAAETEKKIESASSAKSSKIVEATTAGNEQDVYKMGFNALKVKKYEQAATAFRKYITQYPNGRYAANAHYWLGEVYYVQGANQKAAAEFNKVITQYPTSDKVTNAFLKTAFIHASMGKTEQAKQELLKIKKQFPGSTTARLADMKLQELGGSSGAKKQKALGIE